jgi:thiol-disulfide isomerase/thioredoxin
MPYSFTSTFRCRVLLIAIAFLAPVATAQNPNEILDASKAAIAEINGFQAQFRMKGEGGSMFADTLPSMSGQLFFGTNEDFGRIVRAIGEARDKQKDPPRPIDQVVASDRYIWIDREKKTINEVPNTPNARGVPSSLSLVLVSSIINDDPFAKDADNAESITLGAEEVIAGVLCDQVQIKRQKPEGNTRRSAQSYTEVIWWIGKEDKLPRKVHQITDAGMVKITLSFEMSNLRVMEPEPDQLDVRRPADFQLVSRMPTPPSEDEPEVEIIETLETINRDVTESRPTRIETTTPSNPVAPAFSFSTTEGTSVSNATQQGRVTAFYFTGSWCIPCAETGPLVDSLRTDIDDDSFELFALSIREGNPTRAERLFNASYPMIPLSVNPGTISADFKVRVFPSIVVIDQAGEIVFQRAIGKGYGAQQLVEDARSAIESALSGS